jgi:hypothetical protein
MPAYYRAGGAAVWGTPVMMSIPFFGYALAFAAMWAGRRWIAVALWALSVVAQLWLFRLHLTDPLPPLGF